MEKKEMRIRTLYAIMSIFMLSSFIVFGTLYYIYFEYWSGLILSIIIYIFINDIAMMFYVFMLLTKGDEGKTLIQEPVSLFKTIEPITVEIEPLDKILDIEEIIVEEIEEEKDLEMKEVEDESIIENGEEQ